MRPRLHILLVAVVLVAAGSCSSSDEATGGATTIASGAPTTGPGSSPGASTAEAVPPAGSAPFIQIPPGSPGDGVSPEGSGCSPPSATGLPDGDWFGTVTAIDAADGTVSLDLGCFFWGEAADVAATADGAVDVPVPNDYWISNHSDAIDVLPVVPDVSVALLAEGSQLAPAEIGLSAASSAGGSPVWWVQVDDGWVVAMQQQYLP